MSKTCTSCGKTYTDEMVFCPNDATTLISDESSGDLIGTVIADRYQVLKLLGEGGMGKVYLAKHVRLPQQVAIKVLHLDMVKDSGAVTRFNREAGNAAQIEHDRVARVFDYGETADGVVYIAMEFVSGVTLRGLIDDSRRLPAVRAANIAYQVAEGLDAAHRLSIVHRDLKPDNILVMTDENGADRCKVVDFGIAKATKSTETQLTQMGMLVGTPEYMSPEQVLGEQLDGRSDVYALALVAFEMFTGDLPFEGNTPERKLTARLIQDPRPLSEVAPDVDWPESLQAAFDHALVREPENRSATALEFANDIVNAVEEWTGLSVLRARTPMSTTAIVAAANESTSAMARPAAAPSRTAATPAKSAASPVTSTRSATPGASTSASKVAIPEPAPKKSPVMAIAAAAVVLVAAVGGYLAFGGGSGNAAAPTPPAASTDVATNSPTTRGGSAPAGAATARPNADPSSRSAPVAGKADAPVTSTIPTTPPPGAPATVDLADAAAAQKELAKVQKDLENAPEGQETVVALRAVTQLQQILPRLSNAFDSTWAYQSLALSYGLADMPDKVCPPLRAARRLATTSAQRTAIEQVANVVTCAP